MPIKNYLDVSTSHVTEEDAKILDSLHDSGEDPTRVIPKRFGWWVNVPDDDEWIERSTEGWKDRGMSDAFIGLLNYARTKGCSWVNLDSDADYEDGLPTFEW